MLEKIKSSLKEQVQSILKLSSEYADFSSVTLIQNQNSLTRFGENEITQNVKSNRINADILLEKNHRVTRFQTDIFDAAGLDRQLKKASALLNFAREDKEFPDFPTSSDQIMHGACDEFTLKASPEKMAEPVIQHIKKCEAKKLLASGIVSCKTTHMAVASSRGLLRLYQNSQAEFSTTVMDKNGWSGWASDTKGSLSALDFLNTGERAIQKSLDNRDPVDFETGSYDVILEPAAVTDLLLFLNFSGLSTMAYHEKRSPFSGKLGQKILDEKINLFDDHENSLMPGMPFDLEGTDRQRLHLIENGVLKQLPYDLKTAAKHKTKSTGHGWEYPNSEGPLCVNLKLSRGNKSLEQIISQSDRCLLLTHLHYTNLINPVDLTITGTSRDGLYWIRNGKIEHAVKNMRFTDSVIRILSSIQEISSDEIFASAFFGGGFLVPALKISDFRFTSKTEY